MNLLNVTSKFQTEGQCLDYIEKIRWPNREIGCVHCGNVGRVARITRKSKGPNKRARLYYCRACRKQFSATSGTLLQYTKLPLNVWFRAIVLFSKAKEGISARQIELNLGMSSCTAWHLCHRIRQGLKDSGLFFSDVETDETCESRRKPIKHMGT
jgi:transposase-like protein